MEQNFCLVGFGKKAKACELIIGILLQEWPLSAAALHKRLTQRCSYGISYQGTHKAIKKMLEAKVLEREGRHYKINAQWIDTLNRFTQETKRIISQGTGRLEFPA